MFRLLVLIALMVLAGPVRAQVGASNRAANDRGTYLGILFAPVAADKTVPGVQITHVLPNSPAARAGLLRQDVVTEYDGRKVRDCEQLAALIHDDRPDRKVKLAVLRDGKPLNVEATLTLGPALLLPGQAKAVPTAPITVAAMPLPDGNLRVRVEYMAQG